MSTLPNPTSIYTLGYHTTELTTDFGLGKVDIEDPKHSENLSFYCQILLIKLSNISLLFRPSAILLPSPSAQDGPKSSGVSSNVL